MEDDLTKSDRMRTDRNFYRLGLAKAFIENGRRPLCFTGRYKHVEDEKWATFTTIRLYSTGKKNQSLCDHVNIERKSLSKYATLTPVNHNRKFYMCGTVSTYDHYGEIRACITILQDARVVPFWLTSQLAHVNRRRVENALAEYGGLSWITVKSS